MKNTVRKHFLGGTYLEHGGFKGNVAQEESEKLGKRSWPCFCWPAQEDPWSCSLTMESPRFSRTCWVCIGNGHVISPLDTSEAHWQFGEPWFTASVHLNRTHSLKFRPCPSSLICWVFIIIKVLLAHNILDSLPSRAHGLMGGKSWTMNHIEYRLATAFPWVDDFGATQIWVVIYQFTSSVVENKYFKFLSSFVSTTTWGQTCTLVNLN